MHHTKRATNDFSLHRLHHHRSNHQTPFLLSCECDGSFGGRSSRDEDSLDPSLPSPRSQLGPKPPFNPFHHHRRSHQSHHNTPPPPESLPLRRMLCSPRINTPGECSFHAKAAVAVNAVTTPITIASGASSHHRLHQPLPPPPSPKSLRLR